jgi:hypothetical protein
MASTFVLHKNHPGRALVASNLHAFIDKLPASRSYQVEVKEYRRERTDPQNHALFGVAYPALERETGFTKDELHEAFCKRFFGTVEKEFAGEIVSKPYRTTTTGPDGRRDVLGTADFARFYDMVQQAGAEAGIYVPDPDPFWREQSAA